MKNKFNKQTSIIKANLSLVRIVRTLGIATVITASAPLGLAATVNWTATGTDANWTTTGNWDTAGVLPISTDDVTIGTWTNGSTITITDSQVINSLTYNQGSTTRDLTGSSGTLALTTGNITVGATGATNSGTAGISVGEILLNTGGANAWNIQNGTLQVSSQIGTIGTGTATIFKTGSGLLSLTTSGQNYAGKWNISGNVATSFSNGFGSGAVKLTEGGWTLGTATGQTLSFANNFTFNGNVSLITKASQTITLSGTLSSTTSGNNIKINSGANSTTILSGTAAYQGSGTVLTIDQGILQLNTVGNLTGATTIYLGNSGASQLNWYAADNVAATATFKNLSNDTLGMLTTGTTTINGNVWLNGSNFVGGNLSVNVASGGVLALSGTVTDTATTLKTARGVTKIGTGTLVLTATNTYAGITTVSAGKLAVNGSLLTTGSVTVASGGTLGGSGTVGNVSVQSGGHFAAGNSITTTFTTTSLSLAAGSITDVELGTANANRTAASTGTTNDRTTVTGALALGGVLNLIDNVNAGSLGYAGAGSYLLFTANTVTGAFSSINNITSYHAKVDTATGTSVYLENYQIATASTLPTTVDLGHTHVGKSFTSSSSTLSIQNTATSATYSEGLDAIGTGTTGDATVSGSVSNLAGTGTSTAISVGLNNATAGAKSGTVTIGFASNGTVSGTSNTTLTSQNVAVSGAVYNYAQANNISSTPVNLGITHVSGTFSNKSLSIQNTAASGDYTEGLNASGSASGVATVSGSISNLAVSDGTSTAISVGLSNTSGTAGIVSGTVAVGFVSSGANSGLTDTALDTQNVTVTGQVNNYATPTFGSETVGDKLVTSSSTSYTLTLGNYTKNDNGSLSYSTTLTLTNTTLGDSLYQDALTGKLALSSGANVTDLVLSDSSVSLESGSSVTLTLSFNTTGALTSGTYSAGRLTLDGTSVNSSELTPLSNVNVDLNFVVVPEPSTWAMLVGGLGMLAFGQRLRRRMSR